MRKLLLGALLLLSTLGFSQIQKIEVEKPLKTTKVGPMGCGADFYEDGVLVTFQDTNYTKITVLRTFKLTLEDFNGLSQILLSDTNKIDDFYSIKTLDSKTLYFKFSKSFGVIYPIILLDGDGIKYAKFPNLTKSQFKKLFDIK